MALSGDVPLGVKEADFNVSKAHARLSVSVSLSLPPSLLPVSDVSSQVLHQCCICLLPAMLSVIMAIEIL